MTDQELIRLREWFINKVERKYPDYPVANNAWLGENGDTDIPKLKKKGGASHIPEEILAYMYELEAEAISLFSSGHRLL